MVYIGCCRSEELAVSFPRTIHIQIGSSFSEEYSNRIYFYIIVQVSSTSSIYTCSDTIPNIFLICPTVY